MQRLQSEVRKYGDAKSQLDSIPVMERVAPLPNGRRGGDHLEWPSWFPRFAMEMMSHRISAAQARALLQTFHERFLPFRQL